MVIDVKHFQEAPNQQIYCKYEWPRLDKEVATPANQPIISVDQKLSGFKPHTDEIEILMRNCKIYYLFKLQYTYLLEDFYHVPFNKLEFVRLIRFVVKYNHS